MATREGIYVEGHEIVERYVGNRLVWQKFIFVEKGIFSYVASGEKDLYVNNTQSGYVLLSIVDVYRIDGDVKLERNGVSFLNVKIKQKSNYFDGKSDFIMSFPTREERDKYLAQPGETKFYKKRGK